MAQSPKRYRSYRSWQMAARYVSVRRIPDGWSMVRWHPDLGRGAWLPPAVESADDTYPQEIRLDGGAAAEALGQAVLDLLTQPPAKPQP